jgi:predicted component of viral defense system (DUF524 family)
MTETVASSQCGPYELVAPAGGHLSKREDGALELMAEERYLVRFGHGSDPHVLSGAMTIPYGGTEGVLQFGNFIGTAELGGRRLIVGSKRLDAGAVEHMLEVVADRLASLPFGATTPTAAPYARDRRIGPDALYHAYVLLRDSMAARGPHKLPSAAQRILARPHETLRSEDPRLIPLGRADRIDAATLHAIQSEPELLASVARDSPLSSHLLAQRLKGRMPEFVRLRPLEHTTDTAENRFVVAALDAMTDIARQFERHARTGGRAASTINAQEAAGIADQLQRWRRHRALEHLRPAREVPHHSTVLRGRPGYRELLRCYGDLLARTRLVEPHDMRALLELRDAALIYEYWCYFQVVAAVEQVVGERAIVDRLASTALGTHVPYGYCARCGPVDVLFNVTFSRPTGIPAKRGQNSYSVRLRPDITVRGPAGALHLFDAKLKRELLAAFAGDDVDEPDAPIDTFRRGDLHKMHAYRDAIGANSVWVLYPGSASAPRKYDVPWADRPDPDRGGFRGVGAIACRPGTQQDSGLPKLIAELLTSSELR